MDDLLLSAAEIRAVTGKVHHSAQAKELRFLGIEHRVRSDGSIAVSRAHFELVFGGGPIAGKINKKTQPDWKAI